MSDDLVAAAPVDTEPRVFVALRRLCRGGMSELGGRWYSHGHPVLSWLGDTLGSLLESGAISLGEPDAESCSMRRASITAAGRARYEALCDKRGEDAYPPDGGR